ncbi:MAG: FtsX-like permease family protein, partial [Sedimentisphaerales bacterium]|nr:FtsX-like permease family protein [Sedimentisphaerales bacterium]
QRAAMEGYLAFVMPMVIIVCGAWIAVLAHNNVNQRRSEIGIMRSLGYGSGHIALLILGKAVLTGLLGAMAGFFIGTAVALDIGPEIFKVTAKAIKLEYSLLPVVLTAAPVFAAVAGFIPAMIAVAQDPARTLKED